MKLPRVTLQTQVVCRGTLVFALVPDDLVPVPRPDSTHLYTRYANERDNFCSPMFDSSFYGFGTCKVLLTIKLPFNMNIAATG